MFKKILLAVFLIALIGLVAAYFLRNVLVERAVEAGCTYALGVDTKLGSARLGIRGSTLELNDFEVRNPDGFKTDNFLTLHDLMVDVNAGSVLDDEVEVDSLIIEGVSLNLEQIDNRGNYRILQNNVREKLAELSSSDDEQKFRIGLVEMRNIQVAGFLKLAGKSFEKSFTMENISLQDVGSDGGATLGKIAAKVVQTLISRALSEGSGLLPQGFGKGLSDLKDKGIETVRDEAVKELKELGSSLSGSKK